MLLNSIDNIQYTPDAFETSPWMVTNLRLKRTDLSIFAFIYNHTLTKDTVVDINQGSLANVLGVTRKTVFNVLNRLVEKGWICKVDSCWVTFSGYVLNYSTILGNFPELLKTLIAHLGEKFKYTKYCENIVINSDTHKKLNDYSVTEQTTNSEKFTPVNNNNGYLVNNNILSCNSNNKKRNNIKNIKTITILPECKNLIPEIDKLSEEGLSTILDYVQNLLQNKTEDTQNSVQKEELVTEFDEIITESPKELTQKDEFVTELYECVVTDFKNLPNSRIEQESFSKEYVDYCRYLLVKYLEERRTGVEILAQNTLFGNNLPISIKRTKATVADIYRLIEDLYPHTQGGIVGEINELLRMLVISCLERNHKPSYKSWVLNLGHLVDYCEGDLDIAKLEISQQLAGEQDLPLAKYKVGSTYLKFNLGKHLDVPNVYYAVVDQRCDPTKGPKYEETNTWLKKYLRMRVGKDHINFDLDGWHDLIDHLFVYSEGNIDVAAETIRIQTLRSATTTVPYGATGLSKTEFEKRENERFASRYPKRGFTDTLAGVTHPKACADMTPEEYEKFVADELAHNEDGSLMKF